jgi:hypothetical protein
MTRVRSGAIIAAAALAIACTGCSKPPATRRPSSGPDSSATDGASASALPPIPSESGEGGQAPVVWVGGTLTAVTEQKLVLDESLGAKVSLKRLGRDATAFFRVVDGSWQRADPRAAGSGDQACVETVLDGQNLLALRVFLGADCGPAG